MITIKGMSRIAAYERTKAAAQDKAKAVAHGYSKVVPLDYAQRRAEKLEAEARARVLKRAEELDW